MGNNGSTAGDQPTKATETKPSASGDQQQKQPGPPVLQNLGLPPRKCDEGLNSLINVEKEDPGGIKLPCSGDGDGDTELNLNLMTTSPNSNHDKSTGSQISQNDSMNNTGGSTVATISSTTVSPRMRSRLTPTAASASTSFDERFKYKISIYSKVSGCRMTNLPDYTIVKQVRVCILEHITHGNPLEVLGIKFAYEKMKNGGLQVITDDKRLSTALASLGYFACIPCKMTFPNSPRVVGFVKDLPTNMEPADLKREIRKQLPEVYSVRYITERAAGRSRPMQRPCAFVSFNLRYLPGSIRVFAKEYEILVPNPMQCTRCCRYGHQGKQCRAEIRCPICGKPHSKQQCTATAFRCVNCKGAHSSTSHECQIWQQGKLMNELRYRGGLTAEEAIDVASNGKIQHKKHYFISPDEYFDNQESFYLGVSGGSGDNSGSDDTDVLHSTLNEAEAPEANEAGDSAPATEAFYHDDSNVVFHPRYTAAQEFLDILTDFYLKLMNPTADFTSASLMPGFEDDSIMQRINGGAGILHPKKPSKIAQQFKLSVLERACVFENSNDHDVLMESL